MPRWYSVIELGPYLERYLNKTVKLGHAFSCVAKLLIMPDANLEL